MKRFWDSAAVSDQGHGQGSGQGSGQGGGLAILLDGKPMRIPGGPPLLLQGHALAHAIAAEWQQAGQARGGELTMDDVPLTRLAGTAQDRIAPDPAPIAAALARYAETDLLCYRAERPDALVARQALMWQPWLDWLEDTHAARLEPTAGIVHRKQDPAALARVHAAMAAHTPGTLAALGIAVPLLGSAVLGLALAAGTMDAAEAHALASLDELFEVAAWGEDAEATRRRATVAADLVLAERFIRLDAMP